MVFPGAGRPSWGRVVGAPPPQGEKVRMGWGAHVGGTSTALHCDAGVPKPLEAAALLPLARAGQRTAAVDDFGPSVLAALIPPLPLR